LRAPLSRPGIGRDVAVAGLGLVGVAGATVLYTRIVHVTNATTVALTLLLVVLLVASTSRLWVAIVTSFAAMFSFNFFFLPPVGTLTIADPENWVAVLTFLAVSLVASELSSVTRARAEAQKAAELARQSEALKSALLASIGHDLRTPLTAIRLAATNLRASWLSDDDRREQSEVVLAEVERLTRLFQNILEMARIDARAVTSEPQWVHPLDVVAAAREQVVHALAGRPIDVHGESDRFVRLDPLLTAAALSHVLENAAQYAPISAPISVRTVVEGSQLVISVRDRGPGIPPGDLPHLFDRFFRGGSARSRASGTGMGLSIARGLLAAEGGAITAANCAEGGAEFTITVPAQTRVASIEGTA
jgi:two-component system sensor histidine kinase KdpD